MSDSAHCQDRHSRNTEMSEEERLEKERRRRIWEYQKQKEREHEELKRRKIEEFERKRREQLRKEQQSNGRSRREHIKDDQPSTSSNSNDRYRHPSNERGEDVRTWTTLVINIKNHQIPSPSSISHSPVRHELINGEDVVLPRRYGEGSTPFTNREEFSYGEGSNGDHRIVEVREVYESSRYSNRTRGEPSRRRSRSHSPRSSRHRSRSPSPRSSRRRSRSHSSRSSRRRSRSQSPRARRRSRSHSPRSSRSHTSRSYSPRSSDRRRETYRRYSRECSRERQRSPRTHSKSQNEQGSSHRDLDCNCNCCQRNNHLMNNHVATCPPPCPNIFYPHSYRPRHPRVGLRGSFVRGARPPRPPMHQVRVLAPPSIQANNGESEARVVEIKDILDSKKSE